MDIDHRLPIEQQREDVYGTQDPRYRSAVSALLCDGVFCAEDAAVLEGMRDYLGLPSAVAHKLFRDECKVYIRHRLTLAFEEGAHRRFLSRRAISGPNLIVQHRIVS